VIDTFEGGYGALHVTEVARSANRRPLWCGGRAAAESPVCRTRDFGYVERAIAALEGVYHKRGFGLVKVILPEQELNGGSCT